MCAREDFGVPETLRAADGGECPGRWCEPVDWFPAGEEPVVERPVQDVRVSPLPFPTVNDVVTYHTGDQ